MRVRTTTFDWQKKQRCSHANHPVSRPHEKKYNLVVRKRCIFMWNNAMTREGAKRHQPLRKFSIPQPRYMYRDTHTKKLGVRQCTITVHFHIECDAMPLPPTDIFFFSKVSHGDGAWVAASVSGRGWTAGEAGGAGVVLSGSSAGPVGSESDVGVGCSSDGTEQHPTE